MEWMGGWVDGWIDTKIHSYIDTCMTLSHDLDVAGEGLSRA